MTDVDISPATAIAHLARRAPLTMSIRYEDRTLTAAQVHDEAARLAGVLAAAGVTLGDRVAYLGSNSPTLLLTLLACARLGAVFVPLNVRLVAGEIRYVLARCGAHTVLVEADLADRCEPITRKTPVRRWLLADDGASGAPPAPRPGWARTTDVGGLGDAPPALPRTFDDLAVLMHTSGTTGRPKGVMLTHGNLWWSAVNIDEVFDTRNDDVNLAVAPLFHIGGLNAFTLRTLVRGGTVVVRRRFDAERTLTDLARHHVTSVFGVPVMFAAVARCPGFGDADLSGVRAAIVAGAPVPAPLIAEYADRGMLLQQAWGMTETAPAATYLPASRTRDKAGSAGVPMPYTRIRLVDPVSGRDIDDTRTAGELLVHGPNVTPGYWDDPDATRAAFTDDGWLRTGDLAERDSEGFISIVGRRTEVINSGGENVYPMEVERALRILPGVTDVAVVGVPDPVWGETVAAVLECPDGAVPSLEDVREVAGRTIARYKLPTRVISVRELPRDATGKVDRCALRAVALCG